MSTHKALRMSWWNAVIAAGALLTAVVLAILGDWFAAGLMTLAAIAFVLSALYARSGRASDITRLNAVEYIDERDRAIGAYAFAIVGVVALLLSLGVFVVVAVSTGGEGAVFWLALGQVLFLMAAWAVANVIAVRRS
ncbi:hypothetical protein [Agrococcus sp. ARC_14]|uniref:hypothetical protein n=1 Tax=Agrococcus sp. ARC_14 TaxID=2919927 RepID=UPI001F052A54|nr:hypothetical protein [Agrococcus sp. ARC_14]MCH1882275.1 hypothetical protein [Agrococcus sp. ARC_14]